MTSLQNIVGGTGETARRPHPPTPLSRDPDLSFRTNLPASPQHRMFWMEIVL